MSTNQNASVGGTVDRLIRYLRMGTYALAFLLAVSLMIVGTVALIAQLKGTWHWQIHLESTISYMGVFVGWLVAALVPMTIVLFTWRWFRG